MKQASEIEALAHRLEVSGADRTRWPAQERLRFAPLIAHDDAARRLVAEAAALDRVMDMAPALDGARLGPLIDRIVAAAAAEGQRGDGNVLPFDRAGKAPYAARPAPHRNGNFQAAALLAASLVVGVFVGTSGLVDNAVPFRGEVTVADADLDATELIIAGNRALEDLL